MPLATVREHIAGLAASGAIVTCHVTRFENSARTAGWVCRVSGYCPPAAAGRRPKSTG